MNTSMKKSKNPGIMIGFLKEILEKMLNVHKDKWITTDTGILTEFEKDLSNPEMNVGISLQ